MKRIIVALTGASGAIPAFYALPATLDDVVNGGAVTPAATDFARVAARSPRP
jgi:3-polyprenyl-4-hydroxybenzoate decarboxylase